MMTSVSIHPPPSSHRLTWRPTIPKKIGASTLKVNDSRRAMVSLRRRGTWCSTTPATKAPNTACTPIRSVAAAQRNVTTMTRTRSESPVLNRSAATRTAKRRIGNSTKAAATMKTPSHRMVSARSPACTTPWVAAPAMSDRISHPTVSSTTPADRMTRPMLRLVRSRSTRILAITGIAEIDMVVARKRLKRIRWLGSVRYPAGIR